MSWIIRNYKSVNKNNWKKFWGFLQLGYKPMQTFSPGTKLNLETDYMNLYSDHIAVVCINNTIFQNEGYVSNLGIMQ